MIEQRKAFRINVSMAIAFSSNGSFLCGDIMNISCNGVFIMTCTLLPVDTELSLHIRLPGDSEILSFKGRVAWSKHTAKSSPAGMGIKFISMTHAHKRRIQNFVNEQTPALCQWQYGEVETENF